MAQSKRTDAGVSPGELVHQIVDARRKKAIKQIFDPKMRRLQDEAKGQGIVEPTHPGSKGGHASRTVRAGAPC